VKLSGDSKKKQDFGKDGPDVWEGKTIIKLLQNTKHATKGSSQQIP
jgi:hypothetical protein